MELDYPGWRSITRDGAPSPGNVGVVSSVPGRLGVRPARRTNEGGAGSVERGERRRRAPRRPGAVVLEAGAQLEANLIVLDRSVLDLAADLGDLEPVDVAQRPRRARDAVADSLVDSLG